MIEAKNFFKNSSTVQLTIAATVFLLLLTGYIMQVNASSKKAYALRDAAAFHEETLRANDRLVAEIDRLRSLSSVMERKEFLDLVPVKDISYIMVSDLNTLAMK